MAAIQAKPILPRSNSRPQIFLNNGDHAYRHLPANHFTLWFILQIQKTASFSTSSYPKICPEDRPCNILNCIEISKELSACYCTGIVQSIHILRLGEQLSTLTPAEVAIMLMSNWKFVIDCVVFLETFTVALNFLTLISDLLACLAWITINFARVNN